MTGSVQLSKGKWYCVLNMKDENGRRKQKWFPTHLREKGNKKKAQEMLQQLLVKYQGYQMITNYSKMPFADYCDYWLMGKKESIDIVTYQGYEFRVAHIKDYFSRRNIVLDKVSPRDIKEFYEYLLREGNRSVYGNKKGLSQRTVKEIALLLKAIFKEAVVLGDIVDNPAERVGIPKKSRENNKQEIFLDEEDMNILRKEIQGHVLEDLIIVTLFYGLRRSEVLGLKWDAIDFDRKEVRIKHTVVKVKRAIAKDTTKTSASSRTYPLPDFIKDKLMMIKEKQQEDQKTWGDMYQDNNYIFAWPDGRLFSPDYVTKSFKKIVQKSDSLPSELTFHDLRKSCVSMMVEDGYSVKAIQKWVGHADAKTTMNIYAKIKDSRKTHIAESLSKKFEYVS